MVEIGLFDPEDVASLAVLFHEMHAHYQGDSVPVAQSIESNLVEWIETKSDTVVLVAKDGGEVCGLATLIPQFNGLKVGDYWFMKDIYVSEKARGLGVGTDMMRACAQHVADAGGSRLDLTVDKSNNGANQLYQSLGADDVAKNYLRWDGQALATLAIGSQT